MALPTNVAELYDGLAPAEAAARHEKLTAWAHNGPSTAKGDFVFTPGSDDGVMLQKVDSPASMLTKALDAPELVKGLGLDDATRATITSALDQYKAQQADLV